MRGTRRPRSIVASSTRIAVVVLATAVLAGCQALFVQQPILDLQPVDGGSQLVGCDQAGAVIVVTQTSHLDPSCTYPNGIEVRASNVVLDCRGATIQSPPGSGGRGITIASTTDVALSDVTVRNCIVKGFTNGIRVTRDGFRSLPAGGEYDHPFSNIVIEDTHIYETRGSGIFVDGYVTGVTMRRLHILDAGGVGVYLEAGSKDNVIERSSIIRSGFEEVTPDGIPVTIGGLNFRYRSTGREGIAVDGSRNNRISNNIISGNSAGGIFLYKNCGEYVHERPDGWWTRRYGADGNVIENNLISDGPNGVWIGSRMAENTKFMDCSDTPYINDPARAVYPDFAKDNVVRGNQIVMMTHAIRVEDDRNRIEGNVIRHTSPDATGVLVGTKERTALLGDPVDSTVVVDNRSEIAGNDHPFEWIHQEVGTTFSGNTTNGAPASFTPGVQPPINIHLFVLQIWLAP
jgi:parallel beta-helix repeat protein